MLKKMVSALLIMYLAFGPLIGPISYAQEATPTPTQEITPTDTPTDTPTETPAETVTPTPTPDQTITSSETPTPTETITPTPTLEETNTATVSATVESNATTGDNTIENGTDASMGTGDGLSQADQKNDINTTSDNPTVSTNEATVNTSADANSSTGSNDMTNINHDAQLQTGDSISSAALLNIINTGVIDSQLQAILLDIVKNNTTGYISLVDLWNITNERIDQIATQSAVPTTTTTTNDTTVNASISSVAVSGDNTQKDIGNNADMLTGNAYAAANMINLLNTKLVNSHLFFAIINIFNNYDGDIVLPNMYRFALTGGQTGEVYGTSTNIANTQNTVSSSADSGDNSQTASTTLMQTGDSTAIANNNNYLNLIYQNITWYYLMLNNGGNWTGKIIGYSDPNSVDTYASLSSYLQNVLGVTGPSTTADTYQNGTLVTNTQADAISGNNTQGNIGGTAMMKTGNSVAIANVLNFINTSFYNSNIFMPIINIFGNWTGNLVFGYPDLSINITSDKQQVAKGDTVTYTVNYQNQGLDIARNSVIHVAIPKEQTFLNASLPYSGDNGTYSFVLQNLKNGQKGSFQVQALVNESGDQALIQKPSLISKLQNVLMPTVQAAENGKDIVTSAFISSIDQDSNMSNNSSSTSLFLINNVSITDNPAIESTNKVDPNDQAPQLTVSSSHNAPTYIYPGDVITFTARIQNNNISDSQNTVLYQYLYDENGNVLTMQQWDLGTLLKNAGKKVTFGLRSPAGIPAGAYQSVFVAKGNSPGGIAGTSNYSSSVFNVQVKLSLMPIAHAAEIVPPNSQKVLGLTTKAPFVRAQSYWFLYAITALFAILWVFERNQRRRIQRELAYFLSADEYTKKKNKLTKKLLSILAILLGVSLLLGSQYVRAQSFNPPPPPPANLNIPTIPPPPVTGCENCNVCTPTPIPSTQPTITPQEDPTPTPFVPTETPIPTTGPTSTPGPTATPTPGPTATPGPGPTATPGPGPTATPGPNNPAVLGLAATASTEPVVDNYNPLVEGIQQSYGQVLGASTEMPATGSVDTGVTKLPSGNIAKENSSLVISKIGLNKPLYEAQQVGNEWLVGDKEVIEKNLNGHTVFYGHDTWDTFGNLADLTNGDRIVRIEQGQSTIYQVNNVTTVSKDDVSALTQGSQDEIVLVSCDTYNENMRVIIKAQRV